MKRAENNLFWSKQWHNKTLKTLDKTFLKHQKFSGKSSLLHQFIQRKQNTWDCKVENLLSLKFQLRTKSGKNEAFEIFDVGEKHNFVKKKLNCLFVELTKPIIENAETIYFPGSFWATYKFSTQNIPQDTLTSFASNHKSTGIYRTVRCSNPIKSHYFFRPKLHNGKVDRLHSTDG